MMFKATRSSICFFQLFESWYCMYSVLMAIVQVSFRYLKLSSTLFSSNSQNFWVKGFLIGFYQSSVPRVYRGTEAKKTQPKLKQPTMKNLEHYLEDISRSV